MKSTNLLVALLIAFVLGRALGQPLALDPKFVPVVTRPGGSTGGVAIQPDGKVIVVGSFTAVNGTPRQYIARLDSDGNLLLNLGVLGTIANENPTNLTVLVMDNGNYLGSHKKEPGMRTATGGKMKLQEVAKGCGIASAHLIQDAATFREKIQMALKNDGPHFICAQVEALDPERPPKTKHVLDPRENKYQFAKYIERTEGVQILGGGLGNFG